MDPSVTDRTSRSRFPAGATLVTRSIDRSNETIALTPVASACATR